MRWCVLYLFLWASEKRQNAVLYEVMQNLSGVIGWADWLCITQISLKSRGDLMSVCFPVSLCASFDM